MKIDILGTEYDLIESTESKDKKLIDKDGYCDTSVKKCVVDDMKTDDPNVKADLEYYKRSVKRHELIHAFLFESGLACESWAQNEEMVDWIAIQFPKMQKVFEEAKCED